MKSTIWRALVKSLTWKIIGVALLIFISWAAGATVVQVGKITFAYHLVTTVLYVVHERAWNRTSWGRVFAGNSTDAFM